MEACSIYNTSHNLFKGCNLLALCVYSEVYLSSLRSMETAVECVCSEMSSMYTEYSWLNDVWGFVTHWEGKRRAMNMTADEYEVSILS